MSGIENKVVVITGASSGLGEITARYLGSKGAKLVVGARRIDRLKALVKDLGQPEETAVEADVVNKADVDKLVQTALRIYGRVDVLLNNAGVMPLSPLEESKVEDWERTIDINIKGVLYGVNAVIPIFKEQKSGHIINVSSVLGHVVFGGATVYCASKFAVKAISEGLRQELKAYNVRVTNISPDKTESELFSRAGEGTLQSAFEKVPSLPAQSFADVVAFALSQPESVDINEVIFRPTAQS